MAGSYKNPPILGTDTVYETWKTEVEVWRLMTDIDKKKQALAVTLSLTGQAKAKALELDVNDLNSDNGMTTLITALDSLFLKEQVDLAYEAYSLFDSYKRPSNSPMSEFIIEYERRYTRCKKHGMALPDAVLSFKLLDSADLSHQERQLVLTAASDLKFQTTKSALKRIFCESGQTSTQRESGAAAISIKQEAQEAYYTQRSYSNDFSKQKNASFRKPIIPRGTNPLDKFGKRTTCRICQSVYHWAKDCEHRSSQNPSSVNATENSQDEECNLTLFTKEREEYNEIFMTESFGCGVIDTACTRTVCGRKWFDNYTDSLNDEQISTIITTPSNKVFKFGDGVQVKSTKNVIIPAKIGDVFCKINTEVVETDIPLLLSKESLKKAEAVLDISNDKAEMFKRPVKLNFTSSGHYCIDIQPGTNNIDNELEPDILMIDSSISKADLRKKLEKLHCQFGHASVERLKKLLQNAGTNDTEIFKMLTDIIDSCQTCIKYKKPSPRPVVGFDLASDYNEMVAVDLHQLEKNLWYLHIIDEFSRFSAGAIVNNKSSQLFVQKFIQHWISIHGAPKHLFSDNGGEFNNAEVRDMCENFNIEFKTTAAYSPWSNGVLERHNQILTQIIRKIKDDKKCDWEVALNWALMAKNSLSNNHGYSAYQLVFGRNPNLPTMLIDKPPALEGTTTSRTVADHITALYAARQAFTEAECSEKIRRALRKQIRPTSEVCTQGDKVYYKRPDSPEWKGPAIVLGQNGSVIFVQHGGALVRVHQCRLRRVNQPNDVDDISKEQVPDNCVSENSDHAKDVNYDYAEDEDDEQDNHVDNDIEDEANNEQESLVDCEESEIPLPTGSFVYGNIKPGNVVKYKHHEMGCTVLAKIISRAGKATGKYKNWYNIEYFEPEELKGTKQSVDLSTVVNLELPEMASRNVENEEEEVLVLEDISFEKAKLQELKSWKENKVYEEVLNEGQKCISTRWVCTVKPENQGMKTKARLVVRGFEEFDNERLQKDSPTCDKDSVRLILAIIAHNQWKPCTIDIKTAFLQGHKLERDIFIHPPKEADCQVGVIWRLKKCVYGLSDASLYWYDKVKDVMLSTGGTISKVDPAVFYWTDAHGTVQGVLASHVDDFIWGGTTDFESTIISQIRLKLQIGKENRCAFQYVGMEITSDDQEIRLHQNQYVDNLTPIIIDKARAMEKESTLNDHEKTLLRSKVGQLLWLAHQSRPDVLFDICNVASRINNGTVRNILEINKVIKRVKSERLSLRFQYLGNDKLSLIIFSDASLGNLPEGGSQGAFLIFLVGENGRFSPIAWSSKKIRRVVRSTLAAETLAMADGIDSGLYIATLFTELTKGGPKPCDIPLICITDCKSLFEALKSTKFVCEKRLRFEISGIKELLQNNSIKEIIWSESNKQLADSLTKKGASPFMLLKVLEEGILDY